MLRVMVVDDEPVARRGLVRLLREHPDVEVVAEAGDGDEALHALGAAGPEVVFLDIQMPGLDGIAVAEALDRMAPAPIVVFVTAFDRYAVRAFEVEAADYLLKPFDRERLRESLDRVRTLVRRKAIDDLDRASRILRGFLARSPDAPNGDSAAPAAPPTRLVIRESGRVIFLTPGEIDWVQAAGNYLRVQVGSHTHLVRATLSGMEARLGDLLFVRVSRSALLNVSRIREVRPRPNGTNVITLRSGHRFVASRRLGERLRQAIARMESRTDGWHQRDGPPES